MVTSPSRLVGLLVVHGIGEQKRLDTVRKLVKGLRTRYGDELIVAEENPVAGTMTLDLSGSDARLKIYEVHWADLFATGARGAFLVEKVQSVALFPMLNRRHGLYRPPRNRLVVMLWTLLLVPLSALAYAGVMGAKLLTIPWMERAQHDQAETSLLGRIRQTADDAANQYGPVDKVLDEVAGDLVQYVGGSVPSEDAGTAADRVRAIFFEQLAAACRDGCDEIQVLAHSLGSVIAFNALTGYRMDDVPASSDDIPLGVSRLWTIGSPLEKFSFFFPAMTQLSPIAAYRFTDRFVAVWGDVVAPRWVNFRNPLDAVSGRLRSFPGWNIENRRVWAGGLGRSHTIYERNTHVIDALADSLFDVRRQAAISKVARVRGFLEALAESLAVLAALVLPVLAGAALVLVLALGLPWLIGTVVGVFTSDAVEGRVKDWSALILGLPLLVTLFVLGPLSTSANEHRVWRQP